MFFKDLIYLWCIFAERKEERGQIRPGWCPIIMSPQNVRAFTCCFNKTPLSTHNLCLTFLKVHLLALTHLPLYLNLIACNLVLQPYIKQS